MPRHARLPQALLAGTPDDVEARFYDALRAGDLDRVMSVWADDDEIVCVHPGGRRVIGPAAIRASYEALLGGGGIPVQPQQVHRLPMLGAALHHLVEVVTLPGDADAPARSAWVAVSNVYVKTAQGWRLAAHHASPGVDGGPSAAADDDDAPSTLH